MLSLERNLKITRDYTTDGSVQGRAILKSGIPKQAKNQSFTKRIFQKNRSDITTNEHPIINVKNRQE